MRKHAKATNPVKNQGQPWKASVNECIIPNSNQSASVISMWSVRSLRS